MLDRYQVQLLLSPSSPLPRSRAEIWIRVWSISVLMNSSPMAEGEWVVLRSPALGEDWSAEGGTAVLPCGPCGERCEETEDLRCWLVWEKAGCVGACPSAHFSAHTHTHIHTHNGARYNNQILNVTWTRPCIGPQHQPSYLHCAPVTRN